MVVSSLSEWLTDLGQIEAGMKALVESESYTGTAATNIKSSLEQVYLPLSQSITALISEYQARLFLYADGLYDYDWGKYANLNEDAFHTVIEKFKSIELLVMDFHEEVSGQMRQIQDMVGESNLYHSEVYTVPLENERQVLREV